MTPEVKVLLEREYYPGSRVTNCVTHIRLKLTQRPDDCLLCLADLRNQLSLAIGINAWLNEWKEDATKILKS